MKQFSFPFLMCLVASICFTNSFAQNRTQCLSVKDAESAIRNLAPFAEETDFYLPDDGTVFHGNSFATMKVNHPLIYLFSQKGYLKLDYNGNVFSDLTSSGRQLKNRYLRGIPLGRQELVSVARVSCTKTKGNAYVTLRAKPTRTALDLLNSSILQVEPFNKAQKTLVIFVKRSGRWVPNEDAPSAVRPNLN